MVGEHRLARIMSDTGGRTIMRKLDDAPFGAGDYVSGLAIQIGNCVHRNETSREKIAVRVDGFAFLAV